MAPSSPISPSAMSLSPVDSSRHSLDGDDALFAIIGPAALGIGDVVVGVDGVGSNNSGSDGDGIVLMSPSATLSGESHVKCR